MNGIPSFQLAHDLKHTSVLGNNFTPSSWQRANAMVLYTGRSNVINTTMLTVSSSFEIGFGYIITFEVITDCIK